MPGGPVLSPEESRVALRRLFQQRRIADLPLLFKALRTDAPRSVFRRLSLVGYLSSYSQNGRYYTLDDIPEFDGHGLWQYQGVFFSRHGTLKATITNLVEVSDSGHTHGELEAVLRVRVHNMLLDLVKGGHIGREIIEGLFLYVSAEQERAAVQVARRHQKAPAAAQAALVSGPSLEIAVLVEVIHGARLIPTPAQVVQRLVEKGVQVAHDQVEAIFHKHGLKKTPRSRPRPSQR